MCRTRSHCRRRPRRAPCPAMDSWPHAAHHSPVNGAPQLAHVCVAAASGIASTGMAHQPGSNVQDLFARVRASHQQRKDCKHTKQREADRA